MTILGLRWVQNPQAQRYVRGPSRSRALVKKIVNLARGLGTDARNFGKVGGRRAFDGLERSEMVEQRALAGRPDTGDFLQSTLADVAPAPGAMRADRKTVGLVAQPLHEVQHRIARLELEGLPPRQKERLHPGIAVRSLRDAHERNVGDAERGERLVCGAELSAS